MFLYEWMNRVQRINAEKETTGSTIQYLWSNEWKSHEFWGKKQTGKRPVVNMANQFCCSDHTYKLMMMMLYIIVPVILILIILTSLPSAHLWRAFVAQWRGNLSQGESFENKDKWEWKFTQMQKLQSVLWMAGALQTRAINQGTSPWWVVILFVCILLVTILRKKHFIFDVSAI